jgi:hypothetical protein
LHIILPTWPATFFQPDSQVEKRIGCSVLPSLHCAINLSIRKELLRILQCLALGASLLVPINLSTYLSTTTRQLPRLGLRPFLCGHVTNHNPCKRLSYGHQSTPLDTLFSSLLSLSYMRSEWPKTASQSKGMAHSSEFQLMLPRLPLTFVSVQFSMFTKMHRRQKLTNGTGLFP